MQEERSPDSLDVEYPNEGIELVFHQWLEHQLHNDFY